MTTAAETSGKPEMNENMVVIDDLAESQVVSLAGFLSGIPNVTVLHADDPFEGVRGMVAFYEKDSQESSVWLRSRFANAVEDMETFSSDSDVEQAKGAMIRCLTGKEWVQADDPKRRLVGFVKYEPIGSPKGSSAMMFSTFVIKSLPEDVRKSFQAWRDERVGHNSKSVGVE